MKRMRFFPLLVLAALGSIFAPVSAPAREGGGGWHSSGGELFGDSKNPWFVSNTADVKYCVKVDRASVNATPETVRRLIGDALAYWKNEFARTVRPTKGNVEIATQTFTEVDCALGIADLQFLVGYGALDEEKTKYLERPEKYIGVTVRTDYDTVNLRGKGFVYLSSDLGPHSYMTSDLRQYTLVPEAWKMDTLLFYAILHEMGHVFGFPHTGSGLMSEAFLEQLLNQNIYEAFLKQPVESFLFPNANLDSCDLLTGPEKAWFGASLDARCLRLAIAGPYSPIVVYSRAAGDSAPWVRIGRFVKNDVNLFDIRHRPAVLVSLPDEQKVFTPEQANYHSYMVGGMFYEAGSDVAYVADANPVPRAGYLSLTPMSAHLTGVISGQAKTVFNYNSWIATKLYLSSSQ
jgi:hypothetical protein